MTKKRMKSNTDTDVNKTKLIEFFPEAAVLKEMKGVPTEIRDSFIQDLNLVARSLDPINPITHLDSLGKGVIELKVNGSPAWRCIYYTKLAGRIVVVHATDKTTEGRDRKIANVVEERLKALKELERQKSPKKPKGKKKH